jgi:hypothetical protein
MQLDTAILATVGEPDDLIVANNRLVRTSDRPSGLNPIAAQNRLTWDEAIRKLNDHEAQIFRARVPLDRIRIVGDMLVAADRTYRIDESGMDRLCQRIGAPSDYFRRLSGALRADLFQHHFRVRSFSDRKLTSDNSTLISREGVFLDLARGDLFRLPAGDALEAVREGVGADAPTLEVKAIHLHDETIVADIVSPRLAEEVRRGDVIQSGIRIRHSLLGSGATAVMAYMVRLVCENGMTHRDCMHYKRSPRTRRIDRNHPNARELQKRQISRLVAETWQTTAARMTSVRRLQDERVDAAMTLEQFLRRSRLHSRRIMQLLLDAWVVEGSESTAFGVLNALTRVATHSSELSERQRQMLGLLAGVFANRQTHICPRCFSVLRDLPSQPVTAGVS